MLDLKRTKKKKKKKRKIPNITVVSCTTSEYLAELQFKYYAV